MLKKESVEKIAKHLKLDVSALETALTSKEEVDVEIAELNVFTTDELTTRDANLNALKYKEGKEAGEEMIIKAIKKENGIEVDGKDPIKVIEAIKTKVLQDAKIEPSKKIDELNGVIATLQSKVKEVETEKTNIESKMSQIKLDSKLMSLIPDKLDTPLTKDEVLGIIKSKYSFVEEGGKMIVKEGETILRDPKLQTELTPGDVIPSYLKERKFLSDEQRRDGRGGGNDGGKGGVYTKLSEITKDFQDQGKSLNGQEYAAAVSAAKEANPSLDLNA